MRASETTQRHLRLPFRSERHCLEGDWPLLGALGGASRIRVASSKGGFTPSTEAIGGASRIQEASCGGRFTPSIGALWVASWIREAPFQRKLTPSFGALGSASRIQEPLYGGIWTLFKWVLHVGHELKRHSLVRFYPSKWARGGCSQIWNLLCFWSKNGLKLHYLP